MLSNNTNESIKKLLPSIPNIIGENSLRHDIDDLVASTLPNMRLCIVNDKQTGEAFGEHIFKALKGKFPCTQTTLAGEPEASDELLNHIRENSKKCDALIAVGSGTINDLCKYAAHLDGKPYIVFPTAASMNGYLSANASISFAGHKTTVPATLPQAVFCDFGVIANAPIRLSQAGLGDSLARPTAQADWLLSNILLNTPYNPAVFLLLKDLEIELFDSAAGVSSGDIKSIKKLIELLLLSGLGMTIAGGSYPASQGEHMVAHTYNMLNLAPNGQQPAGRKNLHGEEIAITTLYMADLQERLLSKRPKLANTIFPKDELQKIFGKKLTEEFHREFATKAEACQNIEITAHIWDKALENIEKITISPQKLENILKKAKCPLLPQEIGWNIKHFQTTCNFARFTRSRFTFLDLTA